MKFKINCIASGEDIYLHKITVSGERSAVLLTYLQKNKKRRYITKEIIYFIIHSKYFPDSDWLKAHS